MNQRDMFERSFQRPSDYFHLSARLQWKIDSDLGILDMDGASWSEEDKKRYFAHYQPT